MASLRPILAILLLLAQAWPAQTLTAASDTLSHDGCATGCCVAEQRGMQGCGCECQSEPSRPAPQQAPMQEGRGMLPQIARVEDVCATFLPAAAVEDGSAAMKACTNGMSVRHVRAQAVLCAFLN